MEDLSRDNFNLILSLPIKFEEIMLSLKSFGNKSEFLYNNFEYNLFLTVLFQIDTPIRGLLLEGHLGRVEE